MYIKQSGKIDIEVSLRCHNKTKPVL